MPCNPPDNILLKTIDKNTCTNCILYGFYNCNIGKYKILLFDTVCSVFNCVVLINIHVHITKLFEGEMFLKIINLFT